jgi:hypothetical protein
MLPGNRNQNIIDTPREMLSSVLHTTQKLANMT